MSHMQPCIDFGKGTRSLFAGWLKPWSLRALGEARGLQPRWCHSGHIWIPERKPGNHIPKENASLNQANVGSVQWRAPTPTNGHCASGSNRENAKLSDGYFVRCPTVLAGASNIEVATSSYRVVDVQPGDAEPASHPTVLAGKLIQVRLLQETHMDNINGCDEKV